MPIALRLAPHAIAIGAVLAVTLVIALASLLVRIPNVSILYLPIVLLVAVRLGRGPAITASLASFVLFNFFLVDPRFTFTVADPAEWLSLILLLLTAAVTGQLAADQRARAEHAATREREARLLYDAVQLMGGARLDEALLGVAERLRGELHVPAVAIEIEERGAAPHRVVAGDPRAIEALRTTSAGHVLRTEGPEAGHWVRVVHPNRGPAGTLHVVPVHGSGGKVGQVLLPGPAGEAIGASDTRLLGAVAAQLGVTLERARLLREAATAETLRKTDELKTALLNAVSHDLRTPLSSILAAVTSLRQRDVRWSEREREEFLGSIEEEARRLDRVVGNLLDLSRLEAGGLRPEKGWYDLAALVDDVLARLRPLTAHHPIVLQVADDLPPVRLDYVEIDQVLTNLVENAAKHTPAGTEVRVCARRAGAEARVEVADRGPGLDSDELPKLFEPFYRGDGRGPRPRGTGLGLAVAKAIVEAHGGRIWAENRADGGALFAFTVPLGAAEGGAK